MRKLILLVNVSIILKIDHIRDSSINWNTYFISLCMKTRLIYCNSLSIICGGAKGLYTFYGLWTIFAKYYSH